LIAVQFHWQKKLGPAQVRQQRIAVARQVSLPMGRVIALEAKRASDQRELSLSHLKNRLHDRSGEVGFVEIGQVPEPSRQSRQALPWAY
jgi:hypothetical protein